MALQPVFKKGYIEYLKTHIEPSLYLGNAFEYDRKQVVRLYGINHPEDLLERLDPSPDGDLQSAIAIYEAYKGITPLFAQQDDLWVYLTHVDLFEYVKNRWPIKEDASKEVQINFISDHWFKSTNAIRTTFKGFWWSVYCSIDESSLDKYHLTKVLFYNYTFRTRSFGASELFRYREAVVGILGFLDSNPDILFNNFENRGQFISKYFNQLGGVKQLASLGRSFFRAECERIKPKLLEVTDRENVQNVDVFKSINT